MLKKLKFFDADPESFDPEAGMEKFWSGIKISDQQHCKELRRNNSFPSTDSLISEAIKYVIKWMLYNDTGKGAFVLSVFKYFRFGYIQERWRIVNARLYAIIYLGKPR